MKNDVDIQDVLNMFQTKVDASPSFESHDVLISAVKDNERYFPPELKRAGLTVYANPGLALANLTEKEIALAKAMIAKDELIVLSKIPRWHEDELRQMTMAFDQAKVYLDAHLSLAKKGFLIDKLTKISKIISYQANVQVQKKRRFSFFGGGE